MAGDDEKTPLLSGAADPFSFDVLIVGAGISGINAAYRLQTEAPSGLSYAILEGRDTLGGTWDLFRYPGIRSDSEVFTFGFAWSPWKNPGNLAAGEDIKKYIEESARSAGIDQHICYRHAVKSANWVSSEKRWKLGVSRSEEKEPATFTARYVILGTGYYDYDEPLKTTIPGIGNFKGKVIHPQFWPADYDYTGKEVVVIGSGATAITLVPSMADKAKRVTMLQRSPSYVFSLPSNDILRTLLFRFLPARIAHFLNRWLWILKNHLTTWFCRRWPEVAKRRIKRLTSLQLPARVSWDPHFKPRYDPWEQRFCASKDGDLFAALRAGKADVVSASIREVTERSIELDTGGSLRPDVIVTATGLKLKFGGGIALSVDGEAVDAAGRFAWRTTMLQDVPNLFFTMGYEALAWTLGADVCARLIVRVLRDMDRKGATVVTPRLAPGAAPMPETPMLNLSSTYLKVSGPVLPKTGVGQWRRKGHFFKDMAGAMWGDVTTDLEVS